MALGDDLGADDQVHFPVLDRLGRLGGSLRAGERVAGHHQHLSRPAFASTN